MQRILLDPSEAQCLDYASPRYAATRASCINANTTEAQAIQLLINIWHKANQVGRQQWQNQLDEQAAILENHIHLAEEAETHQREAAKIEEEATQKKELKKNKGKYIPIPDRDAPIITPVLLATYAVRKMEKGLYVEMYYYTNKGLDEAINVTGTIDDEAMVLQQNANGTMVWVPAAATRDACGVIDDKDLVWEDFCQAVLRMILAMEQAGWLAEQVLMVAMFWRKSSYSSNAVIKRSIRSEDTTALSSGAAETVAYGHPLSTGRIESITMMSPIASWAPNSDFRSFLIP
ncbi:hypothetical protein AcW1_002807 [Taiwanofungus camphoratus]|nr:hypothetical protein AcW1_002807 [Antrodia cinnamomea]